MPSASKVDYTERLQCSNPNQCAMSEPNPSGQAGPQLSNVGLQSALGDLPFRNPMPGTSTGIPHVPHVPHIHHMPPPPLPPRPDLSVPNYGMNQGYGYGMGSYGMGGYGGYGMGMGNAYGMGMGGVPPFGAYNRYGGNMFMGDLESRFIQMAEESSRPAFDSIQGVVNAVGSVAMMLENTFFALTSSFRAILGVAENFGRLRSLFGQFWSTFAVFRTINWILRKLLVMLGIRTECEFKAWAEAVAASPGDSATGSRPRGTTWPILLFFGVIAAAPYIVHKMLSGLNKTINEKLHDPSTWQAPLRAVAEHDFQATNSQELSMKAHQLLYLAPQHLQGHLWNAGWLMASADMKTAGLVPTNYIKVIKQVGDESGKQAAAPDMGRFLSQAL